MSWRYVVALLAGLAVQLGVKLAHLIRLVVFHDLPPYQHPGLMAGTGGILLSAAVSGLVVGLVARRQGAMLGALNALTPLGFYLIYYLGFLAFGLAVSGGDGGFVGGLIALAWQTFWLRYLLHFAAALLASIAAASLGVALSPARVAAA